MRTENIAADLPSRRFEPQIYGVGAWTAHLHFAYDLIALVRPRLLTELGTDRGESYFAFCQSAAEKKTATRSFAVDSWQGDAQAGQYDETTFAQVAAHNRLHYENFSTLLRCSFDVALESFADASIDLLHLDGLHSEEAVRHDLDNWLPKVRPGGLLLLHDVNVRSGDFGVWKVWDELRVRGRSYTFDDGPSLGIWQKLPNESLPEPLEVLFSGPVADRGALVDYYRRRAAQLQEKIGLEWRDGTVRQLSFLQQTVIQVFYSGDGNYREEDSVNARIGHEVWKEVAMDLPAGRAINGLRIDFVSPLTKIEIASLTVAEKSGPILFCATTASEFEPIALRGDCLPLALAPLTIAVTGIDPQLYLPSLSTAGVVGPLVVRMRLRVNATHA